MFPFSLLYSLILFGYFENNYWISLRYFQQGYPMTEKKDRQMEALHSHVPDDEVSEAILNGTEEKYRAIFETVPASIILVDRINQLRKETEDRADAIVKAVQQRIRPILMTSLTTIIALLPLSIGVGESASLRSPMALAVIGGLVTSTLLTLLVIPCLYDLLDRLSRNRPVETNG